MAANFDDIIKDALSLPPGERAMLADHLLESLDWEKQKEIDAIWAEEAERRSKEIDDGVVTPIPGEEVMSRLRDRYKRRTTLSTPALRLNSKKLRITTTPSIQHWATDFALNLRQASNAYSLFRMLGSRFRRVFVVAD